MKVFYSVLAKDLCPVEQPFAFATHCSIGCGGSAKAAFYPENVEQMQSLIVALREAELPYCVVGNMTNVLPADGESTKLIVCTKRMRSISEKDGFFAEAGASGGELLRECLRRGKSGAEFLTGIPCTLGGALFMNAGVAGAYIAQIVETVVVLREDKILSLSAEECGYAYKTSVFMRNGDVILGARLRLREADAGEIRNRMHGYAQRRTGLPRGKSMGCVFKNPENGSAGKLIDGAGLKGLRIGRAVVSEKHANFILNEGGATSQQIRTLIGIVKNAVSAQYGIRLQEEIRYLT